MSENTITLKDSILSATTKMAEANPGALGVLCQLINNTEHGLIAVMHLDDMNIRGSKIWIGYKDYCNMDIQKFYQCIMDRDKDMQEFINNYGDN